MEYKSHKQIRAEIEAKRPAGYSSWPLKEQLKWINKESQEAQAILKEQQEHRNSERQQLKNATQETTGKSNKSGLILIIIIVIGLIVFFKPSKTPDDDTNIHPNNDSSSQSQEEQNSSQEDAPNMDKDLAIATDYLIYENLLASEKATNILIEAITAGAQGDISTDEMLILTDTAITNQTAILEWLKDGKNSENEEYVDSVTVYIENSIAYAENISLFITTEEQSLLNEMTTALEAREALALDALFKRMLYLSQQGLSDEEIQEILTQQ